MLFLWLLKPWRAAAMESSIYAQDLCSGLWNVMFFLCCLWSHILMITKDMTKYYMHWPTVLRKDLLCVFRWRFPMHTYQFHLLSKSFIWPLNLLAASMWISLEPESSLMVQDGCLSNPVWPVTDLKTVWKKLSVTLYFSLSESSHTHTRKRLRTIFITLTLANDTDETTKPLHWHIESIKKRV